MAGHKKIILYMPHTQACGKSTKTTGVMSNKREASYVLGWQEDNPPALGEGLSRTSNPRAVLWRVDVQTGSARPMITTVRASTKTEALKFSKNRYPTAISIKVLGKANDKIN